MRWSSDPRTLRIIFLVGDAPPHLDYTDDVKYAQTCKKAAKKGIVINAIQCGNDAECARHWKEIASKAGGEYVAIPQGGGARLAATPFDARLGELLTELMDTALIYGDASARKGGLEMVLSARRLRGPAADQAQIAASRDSPGRSITLPHAPVLRSRAPKITRAMRACRIAPTHIAHGSRVTYNVQPGRR